MLELLAEEYQSAIRKRAIAARPFWTARYIVLLIAVITQGPIFAVGLYLQMHDFLQFCLARKDGERILSGVMLLLLQLIFLGNIWFPALCLAADGIQMIWIYIYREKLQLRAIMERLIEARPEMLAGFEANPETQMISIELLPGMYAELSMPEEKAPETETK